MDQSDEPSVTGPKSYEDNKVAGYSLAEAVSPVPDEAMAAVAPNDQPPSAEGLKLDTVVVDGCELPFDYLMLEDLLSVGQTCKRLNQVVGFILRQYYPAVHTYVVHSSIYVGIKKFFHENINKLAISGGLDIQHFQYVQPKLRRLKQIDLMYTTLNAEKIECLKGIFAKLEHLRIHRCEIEGNFHDSVLALHLGPNLKRLEIDCAISNPAIIGNGNEWLGNKYPELEHFGCSGLKGNGFYYEKLVTFLEINQNISLSIKQNHVEAFESWWVKAKVHLDELTLNMDYVDDEIRNILNRLYERGFYKRIKLVCENTRFATNVELNSIKGFVKMSVHGEVFNNDGTKSIPSTMLTHLEELCIHSTEEVSNFCALSSSLSLQRIEMYRAWFREIFPFIGKTVNMKTIYINRLIAGVHFDPYTNVINLVALNKEREKLTCSQTSNLRRGKDLCGNKMGAEGD